MTIYAASVVLDEDTGRLERYVIIAFVDSVSPHVNSDCLFKLTNELVFPFPFAGFGDSRGDSKYGSAYWVCVIVARQSVYFCWLDYNTLLAYLCAMLHFV